jgi:hypothetical protein
MLGLPGRFGPVWSHIVAIDNSAWIRHAFAFMDLQMGKPTNKEGIMNAFQKAAVLALLAMVVIVFPAIGGNDNQALRVYFAKYIDKEISCCQNKHFLQSSRSDNLRMKCHRASSKALFLKSHKNELIEEMVASGLEPKPYKVHLFLNEKFCKTCYANWSTKS